MERVAHSPDCLVPWASAALVFVASMAVVLGTSNDGVWTVDCGSKALQAQRLLDTGFRAFDLDYRAREIDPAGRWFPVRPPYAVRHGERFLAQYPVAYAAVAAPFLAAFGPAGLRVPAALGLAACAGLFAAWMAPVLGRRWAIAAGVLGAVATPLAFYGVTIWEHSLTVALALGAQLLAARPDRRRLVAAGVSIGIACCFREEMFLMGIALVAACAATRKRIGDLLWLAAGALPVAAVLLVFNAHTLGHPLGGHVTGNVGAVHAPAAAEALRDLGAILAGYGDGHGGAAALGLMLVGSWVVGLLAARRAGALAPAVALLSAGALAAWLAATLRLADSVHPVHTLARTNGFLLRMPLVALAGAGFALVFRRQELAPLRHGVRIGAFFLLFALPFRVLLTDFLPGFHWAPRMLLPAVPAFAALGIVALRTALREAKSPTRGLVSAAAAGLAVAGLVSSAQAVRLLAAVKLDARDLEEFVIRTQPEVVVTNHALLGQQLTSVWRRVPLLLVRTPGDLEPLTAQLEDAGVRRFTFLKRATPSQRPMQAPGVRCNSVLRYRGTRFPIVFDFDLHTCRRFPAS